MTIRRTAGADADADVTDEGEIEEGDGDENFVKAEIKRMFRRTKTRCAPALSPGAAIVR